MPLIAMFVDFETVASLVIIPEDSRVTSLASPLNWTDAVFASVIPVKPMEIFVECETSAWLLIVPLIFFRQVDGAPHRYLMKLYLPLLELKQLKRHLID